MCRGCGTTCAYCSSCLRACGVLALTLPRRVHLCRVLAVRVALLCPCDTLQRYGDLAFPIGVELLKPYRVPATPAELRFNHLMSGARVAIEHTFSKVTALWRGLACVTSQKVLQQPVGAFYLAACILTNAHTVCYGSQVSEAFRVHPCVTLEQYLSGAAEGAS